MDVEVCSLGTSGSNDDCLPLRNRMSGQSLCCGCAEVREVVRALPKVWPASVMAGPWQQCSSSCGGGWQERALLCSPAPAFLSEAWHCFGDGIVSTAAAVQCR